MILPDGRQPEGAVLLGVLLPARPEEAEIDQAYGRCEDPVPGQALAFQVTADNLADSRQGDSEPPDPVVLVLVPLLTPQVVVPVLAASGRVGADGLDVTVRVDADPQSSQAAGSEGLMRAVSAGRSPPRRSEELNPRPPACAGFPRRRGRCGQAFPAESASASWPRRGG